MHKTATFIGDHQQIKWFIDTWIRKGNTVQAVVTNNAELKRWIIAKRITNHLYGSSILKFTDEEKKDNKSKALEQATYYGRIKPLKAHYIFSIFNLSYLELPILGLAKCAINYHPSPLPRYAGAYGTSRAIWNEEKEYDVTWHLIRQKMDSGPSIFTVIKGPEKLSEIIKLDETFTAVKLEAACLNKAKALFEFFIEHLEQNEQQLISSYLEGLDLMPSDNNSKSEEKMEIAIPAKDNPNYYKIKDKLDGNGLIDCKNISAKTIERMHRALTLNSETPNYLGITKIFLSENQLFYPGIVIISDFKPNAKKIPVPGEIVKIEKGKLIVATVEGYIELSNLRTTNGMNLPDFMQKSLLKVGDTLPNVKQEFRFAMSDRNNKAWRKIYINEMRYWKIELQKIAPATLSFSLNDNFGEQYDYFNPDKKNADIVVIDGQFNNNYYLDVLSSILAFIYNTELSDSVTVGYWDTEISANVEDKTPFCVDILPLTLHLKATSDIESIKESCERKIQEIKDKGTFLCGVVLRHPSLRSINLNFPIIIQYARQQNISNKLPLYSTLLTIMISDSQYRIFSNSSLIVEDEREDFKFVLTRLKDILNKGKLIELTNLSTKPLKVPELANTPREEYFQSVLSILKLSDSKCSKKDALIVGNKSITYQQLDEQSNGIAERLAQGNILLNNTPIILFAPIDPHWLTALLGILKAGGCYVPLSYDAVLPGEFVEAVLSQTESELILCRDNKFIEHYNQLYQKYDNKFIDIKNIAASNKPLHYPISADSIAYIIYTSGSTHKAKGVKVTHYNLTFSTLTRRRYYTSITKDDVILPITAPEFDATTGMIFWSLSIGATLVLLSHEDRLSLDKQVDNLVKQNVTCLITTSSHYYQLLNYLYNRKDKDLLERGIQLKTVILGGSRWPTELYQLHLKLFPKVYLYNEYGPTEATVYSTVAAIHTGTINLPYKPYISLGNPISKNVQLYLLNKSGFSVPQGITGQLHIAGPNVAQGYLNQELLTKKSFPKIQQKKAFASGDLVKLNHQGDLILLRRLDNEIKIRGIRVDVQPLVSTINTICSDCVIIKSEETETLLAYVTPKPDDNRDPQTLTVQIYNKLSEKFHFDYMIPSNIIFLSAIPHKNNGQVDRTKLPKHIPPVIHNPKHPLVVELIDIWSSLLKGQPIDFKKNLTEQGADSLIYIQGTIKLDQMLQSYALKLNDIQLKKIIQLPTIAEQAGYIRQLRPHRTILLTGATGFFGSHILYYLLTKTDDTIYCLIRGSEAEFKRKIEKIRISLLQQDLDDALAKIRWSYCYMLTGDITKSDLGINPKQAISLGSNLYPLTDTNYEAVNLDNIDVICHCAAYVNHVEKNSDVFNQNNVSSIDHIIDFANAKKVKYIHYISTLSTLLHDSDIKNNYIESKRRAETLLLEKQKEYKFEVIIHHPGQLIWNNKTGHFRDKADSDHFLALLTTCQILKCYPKLNKNIFLLPVDQASEKIALAILNNRKTDPQDLSNKISWNDIIASIVTVDIQISEYSDWYLKLKSQPSHPLNPFIENYSNEKLGLLTLDKADDNSFDTTKWSLYDKESFNSLWQLFFEKENLINTLLGGFYKDIIDYFKRHTNVDDPNAVNNFKMHLKLIPYTHEYTFDGLHLVIRNKHISDSEDKRKSEIIEVLVKYGCKSAHESYFKTTPPYETVIYNLPISFSELFKGMPLESQYSQLKAETKDGFTPLLAAAWLGGIQITEVILGVLKNSKENFINAIFHTSIGEENCIYRAITSGSYEIIASIFNLIKDLRLSIEQILKLYYNNTSIGYIKPLLHHAATIATIMPLGANIIEYLADFCDQPRGHAAALAIEDSSNRLFVHNFIPDKIGYELKKKFAIKYYKIIKDNQKNKSYTKNLLDKLIAFEESTKKDPSLLPSNEELASSTLDEYGYIPLHYCIILGLDSVVNAVIEFIKASDKYADNYLSTLLDMQNTVTGKTCLHLAMSEHYNFCYESYKFCDRKNPIIIPNLHIIKLLQSNGANFFQKDSKGMTPIHELVFTGIYTSSYYSQADDYSLHFDALSELLSDELNLTGEIITEFDKDQLESLLRIACERNLNKTALYILNIIKHKGFTDIINNQDKYSETVLYKAVDNKNRDLIIILLEYGARTDFKDKIYQRTVLHKAVEKARSTDDLNIVRLLIENGAKIDEPNIFSRQLIDLIYHGDPKENMRLRQQLQVILNEQNSKVNNPITRTYRFNFADDNYRFFSSAKAKDAPMATHTIQSPQNIKYTNQ